MRHHLRSCFGILTVMLILVAELAPAVAAAADDGVIVHGAGTVSADGSTATDGTGALEPVAPSGLSPAELEHLVGPVALYPDELLAIVLPAATYPLQIVEADRYLKALDEDPGASPSKDWDESVVALLNYPEVVEKLSADLDWTWALGRAFMDQEEAVLAAAERFRRDAHASGNLMSDRHQQVAVNDVAIEVHPADPAVIYVPRYAPELMRVHHSRSVFRYYPRPCPVYYYPYPAHHYLLRQSRHFWGVTSAFTIAWGDGRLQLHLLEYPSHPYFGYAYAVNHYRYYQPRFRPRLLGSRFHRLPGRAYHWRPDPRHAGARPGDGTRWGRHRDHGHEWRGDDTAHRPARPRHPDDTVHSRFYWQGHATVRDQASRVRPIAAPRRSGSTDRSVGTTGRAVEPRPQSAHPRFDRGHDRAAKPRATRPAAAERQAPDRRDRNGFRPGDRRTPRFRSDDLRHHDRR